MFIAEEENGQGCIEREQVGLLKASGCSLIIWGIINQAQPGPQPHSYLLNLSTVMCIVWLLTVLCSGELSCSPANIHHGLCPEALCSAPATTRAPAASALLHTRSLGAKSGPLHCLNCRLRVDSHPSCV